ncbi:MAG: hypothetical protein JWO09_294 [Bacteroidetes bacterium]|nr:hypothetical protein [Bacteroidota bacterium]
MPNFDFHSNLSSIEFERLIRDMLREKFKGFEFRTYKSGKDSGIDIKSISGSQKILCQAKLYQNNYPILRRALKDELKKVKRIKPDRYIIATSCSLTNQNIAEILDLFNEIKLQEEDVWDRERLNHLLTFPEFKGVLKNHLRLFLTDLTVLEDSIRKTVNNDVTQFSLAEVKTISDEIKYYVKTRFIAEALAKLIDEQVIIISGVAGSGKTTTARLIVNNLLNDLDPSTEFYKVTSVQEAWKCFDPERRQIFLLDDFWGSFIEALQEPDVKKSEKLISFLEQIKRHENHYAIITSRDYIIKHEDIQKQSKLRQTIESHISIIKLPELSKEESADILLRQIYGSDFDREYITKLYYLDTLESIVSHSNFNPRLINQFIYEVFPASDNADKNCYTFYHRLIEYLNNPDDYWRHLLNIQTDTGRLLLVLLTVSAGHVNKVSLLVTFQKCIPHARQHGMDVKVTDFKNAITTLEDNFIQLSPHEDDSFTLRFKNGSIGDHLRSYLQEHILLWFPILINGLVFYDQFVNVFSTKESNTHDRKVLLPSSAWKEYRTKLLESLWDLPNKLADLQSEKFFAQNEVISRLLKLTELFDITKDIEIRTFLIDKTSRIIKLQKEQDCFPFERQNLSNLSTLLMVMTPYLNFDKSEFLSLLFFSIEYLEDFEDFISFSSVYPEEYKLFVGKNRVKVREYFEHVLIDEFDNAEYESDDDEDSKIDLIDLYYEETLKGLNLRHSTTFQNYIFENYEVYLRARASSKKNLTAKPVKKNFNRRLKRHRLDSIKKGYWKVIRQYAKPEHEIYSYSAFEGSASRFHEQIVAQLVDLNCHLSVKKITSALKALALHFYLGRSKWYTENSFRKIFFSDVDKTVAIDFSPVLVQQEKWFSFKYSKYAEYLTALYVKEDVDDGNYPKLVKEYIIHKHDSEVLGYLLEIDKERVCWLLLKPLIESTFQKLNFTNEETLATSFIVNTGWGFSFSFKQYRGMITDAEEAEGSGGDEVLGSLIKVLTGKDEDFTFFGSQLLYNVCNNSELLQEFASYCKKNVPATKGVYQYNDNAKIYELELAKHINTPQFYEMAVKSNWVNELNQNIQVINTFYKSLQK